MTERADVCVIGGGATGLGVARDLALRGLDVHLVERGALGGGTTGHSHGVLHSGARYAGADPAGARQCVRENRVLREVVPGAVDDTGGLVVQLQHDDPTLEERREACEAVGVPTEPLSPAEAHERAPEFRDGVAGAFAVPDAVVHPTRLVAALASDCRDRGVTVEDDAPASDVAVRSGRVTGVVAGGRRIECEHVVNATGAWAGRVAALAGASLEMRPTAGAMVDVSPADVERTYWGVRPIPAAAGAGRDADRGFTVVDHADDGVAGLTSVVGGKLTTHRLMAEATADWVAAALGVDADCRTDRVALRDGDDPAALDALAREFGISVPADASVVGRTSA